MIIEINKQKVFAYTGGKNFNYFDKVIIFLHGAQNDHSVWGLQSRFFAYHNFSILALDLPGHGRSQGEPLKSIESMSSWLSKLIDFLNIKNCILIGHSMGALVALEAASNHKDKISGIALLGAGYPMKVSDELIKNSLLNEDMAIDMVNIWSHSSISQKPSAPSPGFYTPNVSKRLMQYVKRKNKAKIFNIDFLACNNYTYGDIAAGKICCPVLFLSGKNDLMIPKKTNHNLVSKISNSKIIFLDNCGHSLMTEQPNKVLNQLNSFIKSIKD